jgi:hypothetical protein
LAVYGDASGGARKTAASATDYMILRAALKHGHANHRMMVPHANPPVTDRVNAVNARLMSASGKSNCFIHPRCKELVSDLARVSWKPGTRDIDKRDKNRTHASDAAGYFIVREYRVSGVRASAPPPQPIRDFSQNDPVLGARW